MRINFFFILPPVTTWNWKHELHVRQILSLVFMILMWTCTVVSHVQAGQRYWTRRSLWFRASEQQLNIIYGQRNWTTDDVVIVNNSLDRADRGSEQQQTTSSWILYKCVIIPKTVLTWFILKMFHNLTYYPYLDRNDNVHHINLIKVTLILFYKFY